MMELHACDQYTFINAPQHLAEYPGPLIPQKSRHRKEEMRSCSLFLWLNRDLSHFESISTGSMYHLSAGFGCTASVASPGERGVHAVTTARFFIFPSLIGEGTQGVRSVEDKIKHHHLHRKNSPTRSLLWIPFSNGMTPYHFPAPVIGRRCGEPVEPDARVGVQTERKQHHHLHRKNFPENLPPILRLSSA
jgi:hypothetical protein